MIEASVSAWSEDMGTDPRTLGKRLAESGWTGKPGDAVPFRPWIIGLLTDRSESARDRLNRVQAERIEREEQIAKKELIEWETAVGIITEKLINPAISALDTCKDVEWVERVFKPVMQSSFLKK
jgi:hypothetical protein